MNNQGIPVYTLKIDTDYLFLKNAYEYMLNCGMYSKNKNLTLVLGSYISDGKSASLCSLQPFIEAEQRQNPT